jgi:hypothetical protein
MLRHCFPKPLFLAAVCSLATLAVAQEPTPSGRLGEAVGAAALGELRGGAETTTNQMYLQGSTSGNSADRVATGSNSIGQGSFTGMSGIPLVVQNTGANVLIQNAVIVNVKMN